MLSYVLVHIPNASPKSFYHTRQYKYHFYPWFLDDEACVLSVDFVLSFGFLTRRALLRLLFLLLVVAADGAAAVAAAGGGCVPFPVAAVRWLLFFLLLLVPVVKMALGLTAVFFELVAAFFVSFSLRLANFFKFSSSCFFCKCNTNAATGPPWPVVVVVADPGWDDVMVAAVVVEGARTPPPGGGFGRAWRSAAIR